MSSNEEILSNIIKEIREISSEFIGQFNNIDNNKNYENHLNSILRKYYPEMQDVLKFRVISCQKMPNIVYGLLYYKDYQILNFNSFFIDEVVRKIKLNSYEIKNGSIILSHDDIVIKQIFKIDLNQKED